MNNKELLEVAVGMKYPICSEWDCSDEGIYIGTGKGDMEIFNPSIEELMR